MKITDKYSLTVVWSEEDGSYVATCPLFPGLMAFGDTKEEAVKEAEVALEGIIDSLKVDNAPIPEPDILEKHSGQFTLRIPKSLHRKLSVVAEREGVSLNQHVLTVLSSNQGGKETADLVIQQMNNHFHVNIYNVQNTADTKNYEIGGVMGGRRFS